MLPRVLERRSPTAPSSSRRCSRPRCSGPLVGYAAAVVIGTAIGAVLSQVKVLRTGVASLITGLQTMPSVLWYPMALVLFGLSESRHPVRRHHRRRAVGRLRHPVRAPTRCRPLLLRAGRVLGAKRFTLWREVVLPGLAARRSSPASSRAGRSRGARSWPVSSSAPPSATPASAVYVDLNRTLGDYTGMYATMILILLIGIVVDAIFNVVEKHVNRRRGLIDAAAA